MKNRLFNLFQGNAKRGSFRAEGNTIWLYDMIVGSKAEAEWYGGVDPQSFSEALAAIKGDVHLRINSPGGDVFGGRAIAQAMSEHKGNIVAHVDGYAASAASIIAVTAGKVIMAPGSFMMIHNSWTFAVGNADDLAKTAALLAKIDGTIAETYAARGAKTADEFSDLMSEETWFTPQEAVDAGLADEVAPEAVGNAKNAAWNLSAYERAPAAPEPVEDEATADPVEEPPLASAGDDIERRVRMHAVRMLS